LTEKTRSEMFKGKNTVLKNGFYEKLKNVRKHKQDGAISGCVTASNLYSKRV